MFPPDLGSRGRRQPVIHRGRVLDAQPVTDPRIREHPISAVLRPTLTPRAAKVWRAAKTLDQKAEGACVGHGWTHFLGSSPVRVGFSGNQPPAPTDAQAFAFWLYHEAKKVDPWPGEDYDGTSIDAAASVLKRLGFITGYRWAVSRGEFVASLLEVGPVIVAIPWHDGMYEAPGGRLRVTGAQVGWHCLLVDGYDPRRRLPGDSTPVEAVRFQNSWGPGWGWKGLAWAGLDEVWPLLSSSGADLCIPLGERFVPKVGTPVLPVDLEVEGLGGA